MCVSTHTTPTLSPLTRHSTHFKLASTLPASETALAKVMTTQKVPNRHASAVTYWMSAQLPTERTLTSPDSRERNIRVSSLICKGTHPLSVLSAPLCALRAHKLLLRARPWTLLPPQHLYPASHGIPSLALHAHHTRSSRCGLNHAAAPNVTVYGDRAFTR